MNEPPSGSIERSLSLITAAGCLAMVYITATNCPAFADFFRALGARDGHFGLLSGIPMLMLGLQFLGAYIANRVTRRKPWFMTLHIAARTLFIPVAFLPSILPGLAPAPLISAIIAMVALNAALGNLVTPMWFSWVADLVPRDSLSRYWGRRQRWMHLTWTAAYLATAAFSYLTPWNSLAVFQVLAVIAVLCGVADILLFVRVWEPPNVVMRTPHTLATFLSPLKDRPYRSFFTFACIWALSASFSGTFIQIYMLKVLGMSVWASTLALSTAGIGTAIISTSMGRMVDRYGSRPILVACTAMKSMVMTVMLLVTPSTALWILLPTFFIDNMWNSGLLVASNGFMLRLAPRENRSMFIAFITGLAGICGGIGAMLGGAFLEAFQGFHADVLGRPWTNYHLLFLAGIPLRILCIQLARRIREPRSATAAVLRDGIREDWRLRMILFPVDLYCRLYPSRSIEQDG